MSAAIKEIEAGIKEFEEKGYSHEDGYRAYKFWTRELLAEFRRIENCTCCRCERVREVTSI